MDYHPADFDTFVKVPIESPGSGAKKRKPSKGPFYFFMMDKKTEWNLEGKLPENCSMKRLVEDCKPLWKLMKSNPCLMEPYIERARLWKQEQNKDLENVYDSMGRSLAEIKREAQRVRDKQEKMEEEIEIAVKTSGNVVSKKFHVAYFNYLCKTAQDFFPPCEVSVVKFSIEGGVIKTWHKFISPLDSIPIGYKYRCIYHARNTHFLTPDFDLYDNDIKGILDSLVEFLGGVDDDDELPPLYVMPDHMPAADCISDFIVTRANSDLQIKVFTLTKLFQELANYPSITIAEHLLEDETKYSHFTGLGCDVHETLKNSSHCSLAICQRQVFNVLNRCLPKYKIQARSGKHYPVEKFVTLAPHQINIENLAIEDRINRMIPTPAGVTDIPPGLDEETARKLQVEVEEEKPEKKYNIVRRRETPVDYHSLGAIPKQFGSLDIREVNNNNNNSGDRDDNGPKRVPSSRPAVVKVGKNVLIK